MWAEPPGGYRVIWLTTEITWHLVVGTHLPNINRDRVFLLEAGSDF